MVSQEHAKQRTKRHRIQQQAEAPCEALQAKALQSGIAPSIPQRDAASAALQRSIPRLSRMQVAHDIDLPAVAPCKDLQTLRRLTPDATRHHVNHYLHTTMPATQADDFEALAYRWELHLVELDHIQLLRLVDMNRRKLSRYRTALRKGAAFPPLVALGGDGPQPTEGVLLCDGYHRIIAMRDIGLHFAWVWLAVDLWREQASETSDAPVLISSRA